MGRLLKWLGIGVGGLVVLVILTMAVLYFSAQSRLDKTYDVKAEQVTIPADAAAIERGRRLVSVHCTGCHGENLAGTAFFEDPGLGKIPAPNLTKGEGGIGASYGDGDWVRAIRHGLLANGKPFLIMPSGAYYWFSDDDLGEIIAYMKSVPAVDNNVGQRATSPLANVLFAVGALGNAAAAETISHNAPRPPAPVAGLTAAYGEYLEKTFGCADCHGATLAGGRSAAPGAPWAPNLRSGGSMDMWSEQDFLTAIRVRESAFMPYKSMARMSDDELKALWLYLRSLPAETGAKK